MSVEIAVGYTTVASREAAEVLGLALVESRLVACVQMVPVESLYVDGGVLQGVGEVSLALKFAVRDADWVEAFLVKHHPYEVPQWFWVRAEHAYEPYRRWVEKGGGA